MVKETVLCGALAAAVFPEAGNDEHAESAG